MDLTDNHWIEWVLLAVHLLGLFVWARIADVIGGSAWRLWQQPKVNNLIRYGFLGGALVTFCVAASQLEGVIFSLIGLATPTPARDTVRASQVYAATVFIIYEVTTFIVGWLIWFYVRPHIKRVIDASRRD